MVFLFFGGKIFFDFFPIAFCGREGMVSVAHGEGKCSAVFGEEFVKNIGDFLIKFFAFDFCSFDVAAAFHKIKIINFRKRETFFSKHLHEFVLFVNNKHENVGKFERSLFSDFNSRNDAGYIGPFSDLYKLIGTGVVIVLFKVKSRNKAKSGSVGCVSFGKYKSFSDFFESSVVKIFFHCLCALFVILITVKKPCFRKGHMKGGSGFSYVCTDPFPIIRLCGILVTCNNGIF